MHESAHPPQQPHMLGKPGANKADAWLEEAQHHIKLQMLADQIYARLKNTPGAMAQDIHEIFQARAGDHLPELDV